MAEPRIDFSKKCPNCGDKYMDHDDEQVINCVKRYDSKYDGTLPSMLALLHRQKIASKFGQPSSDKRVFAIWDTEKKWDVPLASAVPNRDFGILFLSRQTEEKEKKENKVINFFGGNNERTDSEEAGTSEELED